MDGYGGDVLTATTDYADGPETEIAFLAGSTPSREDGSTATVVPTTTVATLVLILGDALSNDTLRPTCSSTRWLSCRRDDESFPRFQDCTRCSSRHVVQTRGGPWSAPNGVESCPSVAEGTRTASRHPVVSE